MIITLDEINKMSDGECKLFYENIRIEEKKNDICENEIEVCKYIFKRLNGKVDFDCDTEMTEAELLLFFNLE